MAATAERIKYKFRLKEGIHVYKGSDGRSVEAVMNDVIETVNDDLAARFGRNRFEVIDRQVVREPLVPVSPNVAEAAREGFDANTIVDDGLDVLSLAELKKLAKTEDIDLTGTNGKDEVITTIRMARDTA